MKTIIDKSLILNRFKEVKNIHSDAELADYLGITKSSLSNWRSRNSIDYDLLFTKCEGVNLDWLITGEGDMLRSEASDQQHVGMTCTIGKGIPLVNISAVAGFGNADFAIAEADVKEYYIVPKFKYCRVDFMIEISGSSMYPKYNSGDVVACTILHERNFIQWNKCHIIATREQGILCKRLRPSEREGCITAVSDNKDYPPFDIPVAEITGIALVCGGIRLE